MISSEHDNRHALNRAHGDGILKLVTEAAAATGLPEDLLVAIGLRETWLQNIEGDFRGGEYHGIGVLQGDIQHPQVRQWRDDGSWRADPAKVIRFCCTVLGADIVYVQAHLGAVEEDVLYRLAADSYNAGPGGMMRGHDRGDADLDTTDRDYGRDVWERAQLYRKWKAGG